MMRIVQLIDSIHIGGAEKLLVTYSQEAERRGIPVWIIGLRKYPGNSLEGELTAHGAQVTYFTANSLASLPRFLRILGFLRQSKFDVIHTHLAYANILGVLAGQLTGIPVVATLHSAGLEMRPRNRLEGWAIRQGATRILAVGENVAEAHQKRLGKRKIDVIPNAVADPATLSAQEREALRTQLVGDSTRPLLIAVGRLTAAKGYLDLLRACAQVRQSQPHAAWLIAGDGDMRPEMERLIVELDLEGTVYLLGRRSDVPRLLAAADIFVNASHWEGLPLSVLEAMMVGLPVIATQVGDVPAVLVPGSGILVPPQQPASLAAAVSMLLEDPEQRAALGERARQHARENYNAAAWFDRWMKLYESCVQSRHSAVGGRK